jgi:channel protein (hemolysin III family)
MDSIAVYGIPGIREPVNCLSHFLAAAVFAILSLNLVQRGRGSWGRTIGLAVLACSSVFLLLMSGIYHMLGPGARRDFMWHLDLAGVFALIAGTFTPIHAILFKGVGRWGPLLLAWSAAAIGITLRMIWSNQLPSVVGAAVFLAFGWSGALSCIVLWRRYGSSFVKPLLWGGVAYTLGVVFLELNWPVLIPGVIGPHELWHVAVLVGLGLHWRFVFQFASGAPTATMAPARVDDALATRR